MATRKTAQNETPTATANVVAQPEGDSTVTPIPTVPEQDNDELDRLEQERKAINAKLRELKGLPPVKTGSAPKPKQQSLADVIAKQHKLPGRWVVLGLAVHTNERVQAGQNADEALSQVAARYAAIVKDVLASRAEGETLQETVWRHLAESYPKTQTRTGPGAKANGDN